VAQIAKRVTALAKAREVPAPKERESVRWRNWLLVFAEICERPDCAAEGAADVAASARAAVAVLDEYLASGLLGCQVEYYCGCCLNIAYAWWHAKEGDSWYDAAYPFLDAAEKLRDRLQIDRCRPRGESAVSVRDLRRQLERLRRSLPRRERTDDVAAMTDAELDAARDRLLPDVGGWLAEHRERLLAMHNGADLVAAVETALASLPSDRRAVSQVEAAVGDLEIELVWAMGDLLREDLDRLRAGEDRPLTPLPLHRGGRMLCDPPGTEEGRGHAALRACRRPGS
jgi:hypothetical protein